MNAEQLKQVERIANLLRRHARDGTPHYEFLGVAWEAWETVKDTEYPVSNGYRRAIDVYRRDLAGKGRRHFNLLRRKVLRFFGHDYDPRVNQYSELVECLENESSAQSYLKGIDAFMTWSADFSDFQREDPSYGPVWCAEYEELLDRLCEDVDCMIEITENARDRLHTVIHDRAVEGLSKTDIERKHGWSHGTVTHILGTLSKHVDWDVDWGKVYREESPGRRGK